MQSVPQRRSREVAENPAQTRAVEKWELRKWSFEWAKREGVSNTAKVLLTELWEHANMKPHRIGNMMRPRHWERDGIHWLKVWPSEETLAAAMQCNQRTVRRAMNELRKAGNIERRRRTGGPPENRSGPNRTSETLIVVPEPERQAAHRLRIAGTAAEIAQAARTDPQVRATLLTAGEAMSNHVRATYDRIASWMRDDVLAVIARVGGIPYGIYRSLPSLPSESSGALLTSDTPVQDTPQDIPVQDKNVRPYRTKMSSPAEVSEENTCKYQTKRKARSSAPAERKPSGLVCNAEQASEPACPVGVKPSEPDSLTPEQVEEVIAAYPNLHAYRHEPRAIERAWRKLKGLEPRSTARNVERMTRLGVRPREAQRVAADYRDKPEVLRAAIDSVQQEAEQGGSTNPAGLLMHRLKKAKPNKATTKGSERSEGYSWAQ